MKQGSFIHRATDGTELYVHFFLPEGEARAVLQIAHGMSEHGARYARLAKRFTAAGFAVYADDHRGHGRTAKGALGQMGGVDAFERSVDDLFTLSVALRAKHPGLPLAFLGHSMGSFMAQRLISLHPEAVDAVILSASNGKPPPIAAAGRLVAAVETLRVGPQGTSPLLQRFSFEDFNRAFAPNRTACDWLSRDEAEVDAYIADPLCGATPSVFSWRSLLGAMPALTSGQSLSRIRRDLPILIAAGTRDPVGDFGKGVTRLADAYRQAGLQNVTLRLYEGARHEILNETNRDEVEAELLAFAERALGLA